MTNEANSGHSTTMIAAVTAVLVACLMVVVTSDLNPGARYGLGAVLVAAVAFCAFRLGSAWRAR